MTARTQSRNKGNQQSEPKNYPSSNLKCKHVLQLKHPSKQNRRQKEDKHHPDRKHSLFSLADKEKAPKALFLKHRGKLTASAAGGCQRARSTGITGNLSSTRRSRGNGESDAGTRNGRAACLRGVSWRLVIRSRRIIVVNQQSLGESLGLTQACFFCSRLSVILICRQRDSRQDTDDRNHDHQFDQGKTFLSFH